MNVQAVDRALKLLLAVAQHDTGEGVGVRELARISGLKTPTAQNLLKTLQNNGFLDFMPEIRKYRIGLAPVLLAERVDFVNRISVFARPWIEVLSGKFDETIAVLTWFQGQAVVVDWRNSSQSLSVQQSHKVVKVPHLMASGRVLLAYQDEKIRRAYAENCTHLLTGPNTPATPEELLAILDKVRTEGYAETANVAGSGVGAFAVPIFDGMGGLAFTVSCSAPLERFARLRDGLRESLFAAAREMSDRLGVKNNNQAERV